MVPRNSNKTPVDEGGKGRSLVAIRKKARTAVGKGGG